MLHSGFLEALEGLENGSQLPPDGLGPGGGLAPPYPGLSSFPGPTLRAGQNRAAAAFERPGAIGTFKYSDSEKT